HLNGHQESLLVVPSRECKNLFPIGAIQLSGGDSKKSRNINNSPLSISSNDLRLTKKHQRRSFSITVL
ncbi:hypothetical protein, partial [Pseudomonas viridiflava]|uniref:hypothetical protein n=1 Tax=Pseudomonas viridiflava TaxID=33069 RepID=UPI00197E7E1F